MLLLSGKEVLEVETGTSDVPVLICVDVEVGFAHNISEDFTEVEWGVKVEEKLHCFDDKAGRIEVQEFQDEAAGENPLHWDWIKNEAVS